MLFRSGELVAARFANGGTAATVNESWCPHCGEYVEWKRVGLWATYHATVTHYYNYNNQRVTVGGATYSKNYVVDMAGYDMTNSNGSVITAGGTGANISILDTIGGGSFNITTTGNGAIVQSGNAGYDTTIELRSGTLTGTALRGGAIALYKGTFEMKGGIIKDSKCTNANANGGAVWAGNSGDANVNISGGLISNCENTNGSSGSIALGQGTFTMTGGIIQGGTTKNNGGNITLNGAGAHSISNAIIRGGSQTATSQNGGNICIVKGASVTIDNSTICAGTATGNGGNISNNATAMTITNSMIYGGTATGNGGNIYYGKAADFSMNNVEVLNGTATGNGGNIYVELAYGFDITDGIVADGHTEGAGGNFYIRGNAFRNYENGAAELTNVRIYNGTAGDPEVDSNERYDNIWTGVSVTLTDSKIQGCSNAANPGSGIYANDTTGSTHELYITLKGNTVVGDVNDPFNASIYTNTDAGTGVCQVVVDGSFTGAAVLSPYALFGFTTNADEEEVSNLAGNDPYGEILVNATYSGNPTGKLYLGDHKTSSLDVWEYGMPEIFYVADGQLQVAGGLLESKTAKEYYLTAQDAVDAYTSGKVVKLLATADTLTLDGGEYYIDVNGKMPTVSATAAATVYGLDSANANGETAGDLTIVGENVTVAKAATSPVDGEQYVNVQVDDLASFHNIKMDITKVTLRTSSAGIFYKGQWTCDEVLEQYIKDNGLEYGVVVSLTDMPGADFVTENTVDATPNLYSVWGGAGFVSGAEQTGVAVSNILLATLNPANERTADENAEYAQKKIYARAYLNLGDGEYIVDGEGASLSMMDVLKKIDQALVADPDFTTEGNSAAAELMATFYNNFKNEGLADAIAEYGYEFQAICKEA